MDENIKMTMEKISAISQQVSVDAVFGKPQLLGDRTVIPVAEVSYGFGLGFGSGPATAECHCDCAEGEQKEGCECECHKEHPQEASGVGGGAGGLARPIAYLEVGPEGVKVEPIMDEQKVALASIFLAGWVFAWLAVVIRALTRR